MCHLEKDIEKIEETMNKLKPIVKTEVWNSFSRVKNILSSVLNASPFQVGDKVELAKTPEISNEVRWGWLGSKHFLIKGSKAEVAAISWNEKTNNYSYGLKFFDESYIHPYTKEMFPVSEKGVYYLTIDYIDLDRTERCLNTK